MNKTIIFAWCLTFFGMVSCQDTKKQEEELNKTLDAVEAVESEIGQTTEEIDQKAAEVEEVLNELDSI